MIIRKIRELEGKLNALAEYLDIELEKTDGFRVKEKKQEIGFYEKEV